MIAEDRTHRLVGHPPLRILADHAQHIVLHRVVVAVELELAAHRFEALGLQRLLQGSLVVQIALDVAHGSVDQQRCIVALRGIKRRQPAVFLFEIGNEALVFRVIEVMRPMRGVEHAEHRRADRLDHIFIGREARREELNVLGKASCHKLLDEVDAHAARQEEEQRIRLLRTDLRQFGRIVELSELGVDLFRLTLVVALEAGDSILAARIIRRNDHDVAKALVLNVLAHGFVQVVVLPGHVEEEGVALLAGVLRRAGIGRNVIGFGVKSLRANGEHDVREDDTGHEIDLVLFQEFLRLLLGDIGLLLIVGNQHFDRQIAELSVQMLDAQLEAVANIDTQPGTGAGKGRQKTDLHLVGSVNGGRQQQRSSKRGD